MRTSALHTLYFGILSCFFLFGVSLISVAQETDTTKIEIQNEQEERRTLLDQNYDRPITGGSMTDMGTYSMPNETQYYHAPFEGQESLDRAVEAYFKEMENKLGKNWYWQFLRAVSPYVRLHLGVSEFNSLNIVDRDNPLFKSYKSNEKRQ